MVGRFNQPAIPSPVVGTPGIDPSAGVAAGEVSKLSAQSTQEAFQAAQQQNQEISQIQNKTVQEIASANYFGSSAAKHTQVLQNGMQLANTEPQIAADMAAIEQGVIEQTQYDGSPASIGKARQAPTLYQDLTNKYQNQMIQDFQKNGNNPDVTEKLATSIANYRSAGAFRLSNGVDGRVTSNLDVATKRLADNGKMAATAIPTADPKTGAVATPTQALAQISQVAQMAVLPAGEIDRQFKAYPQLAKPESVDNLKAAIDKTRQETWESGLKSQISALPRNELGMSYADEYAASLDKNPYLTTDQKVSLRSQVETVKNDAISKTNSRIDLQSQNGIFDARIAQGQIINDYQNKTLLQGHIEKVQQNVGLLVQQKAEVDALPDSNPFKRSKLLSLNKQIAGWTTDIGVAVKDVQNADTMQRILTTFGQSQILTANALNKLVSSAAHAEKLQSFNDDMVNFDNEWANVRTMPLGSPEQHAAASALNDRVIKFIDSSVKDGSITRDQWQKYLKENNDTVNTVYRDVQSWIPEINVGPLHIPRGSTQIPTTSDQYKKQVEQSSLHQAAVLKQNGTDNDYRTTLFRMADNSHLDSAQTVMFKNQLRADFPDWVKALRTKGYSDSQIESPQGLPTFYSSTLKSFMKNVATPAKAVQTPIPKPIPVQHIQKVKTSSGDTFLVPPPPAATVTGGFENPFDTIAKGFDKLNSRLDKMEKAIKASPSASDTNAPLPGAKGE